jgi:cytochrome b pre-mRNA-processing protein 3
MFENMDESLREMGVGDLAVGRRVKAMVSAFYGRIQAYESALAGAPELLAQALGRNLYGTVAADPEQRAAMAAYLARQASLLEGQTAARLLAGEARFETPPQLEPSGVLGP